MSSRTIEQKRNGDDFAKARELIEIRSAAMLSLQDRRIINVLYANAGNLIGDDVEHVIALSELRGSHKGGQRVKDSIQRLIATTVAVPVLDKNGRRATKLMPILSDTTVSDEDDNPTGVVSYSFSPGMRKILKDSTLWGRVRNSVVFAFTSKYSLSLYELVSARINLTHVFSEEFSVKDFRSLLGVPDGKLERIPNFLQRVVTPAVVEVNGLADFGVSVVPIRQGGEQRGMVTGFRVDWWRKNEDERKAAYRELQASKIGRIARLSGKAEKISVQLALPPGLDETLET